MKNINIYVIIYVCFVFFFLSCTEEKPIAQLGSKYLLDYGNCNGVALFDNNSKYLIDIFVLKYRNNYQFITIKQKPKRKIDSMYNLNRGLSLPEYQREFSKFKYYQYWIVDKRVDSIYGPFQKPEYLEKMKELNIPDSLRVDN